MLNSETKYECLQRTLKYRNYIVCILAPPSPSRYVTVTISAAHLPQQHPALPWPPCASTAVGTSWRLALEAHNAFPSFRLQPCPLVPRLEGIHRRCRTCLTPLAPPLTLSTMSGRPRMRLVAARFLGVWGRCTGGLGHPPQSPHPPRLPRLQDPSASEERTTETTGHLSRPPPQVLNHYRVLDIHNKYVIQQVVHVY